MESPIINLLLALLAFFIIPLTHSIIFYKITTMDKPLHKFKKRDEMGRISSWEHISTKDILEHKYFKNFFFGRFYRKVAIRIFEIVFEIKEQRNAG